MKTGMDSYHPVEAKTNVQKLFWSKKEVGAIISVRNDDINAVQS